MQIKRVLKFELEFEVDAKHIGAGSGIVTEVDARGPIVAASISDFGVHARVVGEGEEILHACIQAQLRDIFRLEQAGEIISQRDIADAEVVAVFDIQIRYIAIVDGASVDCGQPVGEVPSPCQRPKISVV